MEAVGRLAGGIAHDFNNMLNVILAHTELGMEEIPEGHPLAGGLLEIRQAAERSADLTRQLLAFARRQTVEPKALDLNQAVDSILNMLKRLVGEDLDLLWKPGELSGSIRIDPAQLDQVLANLVVNARDAFPDSVGEITIETEEAFLDEESAESNSGFRPGLYAVLSVSDNGCGMDEETVRLVFEPFYTTKSVGKGTGLGLSTVYGVVRQNDGFINVHSEPGQGSTFRIYLPVHEKETDPSYRMSAPSDASIHEGNETVLLVEDEPAILNVGKRMLERLGYKTLTAPSPGEALALARSYPGEIHLLVTDVVMPEMNGRELARRLLTLFPGMKRLFISGYSANVIAHHGVLEEGVNFLQKPFSLHALGEKLREVMEE
jgi:CheY-like chemotaxis protein